MLRQARSGNGKRLLLFGQPPAHVDEGSRKHRPDWTQARPTEIRQALDRIQALPSGGWFVLDACRRISDQPRFFWVAGRELVSWRAEGVLQVAPNRCPHMSAPLSEGKVQAGRLICPWHGLALGADRHGTWQPLPCFEDGVLAWVRLDGDELATDRPILPARPSRYIEGTIRMIARCDPEDVIANRLDPWHGAHFHGHTFARLHVMAVRPEAITVRVAFRVLKRLCVEVDCTFHCSDPRTIVMTIVDGEGMGSVVETHATPVVPGTTAIVETTLATSDRTGFAMARTFSPLVRPFLERSARRLWREDAAYAERTAYVRTGEVASEWIADRGPDRAPGCRWDKSSMWME